MKLFYGSEEANLTIILLSTVTVLKMLLLFTDEDIVVEQKKRADNRLFIGILLLELHQR